MQFHVYEDWTLEESPRCFYVGKGSDDRVLRLKRNKYHADAVSKFGHNRVIVFSTENEVDALNHERKLIIERHTHIKDPENKGIGCNLTLGGQGNSGRFVSEETKNRISISKTNKRQNKTWSSLERLETSTRMSLLHKGKKLSVKHVQILKNKTGKRAKLTVDQVKALRNDRTLYGGTTINFCKEWSNTLKVSYNAVYFAIQRYTWKNI